MFSNDLFHPDHVIPTAKFIAAVMELSHLFKSQMAVELGAVFRKVFILL